MNEPTTEKASAASARPTHVRYKVVAMAVLLAMVTYLDRVCISKLAPDIMRDFGLSKVQMGWVFSVFALATAASMFTLGASWSTAIELGRNNAGVVSAAMNTSGQVGSLLCPLIVAYSVEWFKSWDLPLYFMGGLFLIGVVCWGLIDPRRPIFGAAEPAGQGGVA